MDRAIFNLEEALARVDDDRKLFVTLAEMFLEQAPKNLAAVQDALRARNAEAVAGTAHYLKGSVMQFASPPLVAMLKDLEVLGKGGDFAAAATIYERVETGLQQLLGCLQGVVTTGETL